MNPAVYMDSTVSEAEAAYLEEQLQQFNLKAAPPIQDPLRQHLRLVLRDDHGAVMGGLLGYMYRYCLFIDVLWISDSLRGTGSGKALLDMAEATARSWGATLIHLDTFSFQAPDFYQHCGYEVFGVLEGYQDGIKRYYLKKNLK